MNLGDLMNCINCGIKLTEIDRDPDGSLNVKCAKCEAEERHDFDVEPETKFDRLGRELETPVSWERLGRALETPVSLDWDTVYKIPVEYLLTIANPLEDDLWDCGEIITMEMIASARYVKEPYDTDSYSEWTVAQHAGRVRYLAEQPSFDPVLLDVGCPTLGYNMQALLDGHHRLTAAVYRGDKIIPALLQGDVDFFFDELLQLYYEDKEREKHVSQNSLD